jgi:SAM-dependent methyltransferase
MRNVRRYFDETYFGTNHAPRQSVASRLFRRDESAITERCRMLLNEVPIRSLLDLGCGPGRLISEVVESRSIGRLVGVDLSRRSLELARSRLAAHPEVIFEESSAESCRALDQRFDAVVSLGMLDYLRLTPSLLSRIVRAANHRVILTAPRRGLRAQRLLRRMWLATHGVHLRAYSRTEVLRLCRSVAGSEWTFEVEVPPGLPDNLWIVGRRA